MKFCLEKLKGRNCLEDIKCVKKYDTTMCLKEMEKSGKMWTGFIWLKLGACGRLL